jgi:hypothetical protein
MITYLVPAIATLLFLVAGFLIILGGASPGQVNKGKEIFKTTAYGILIVYSAWLVANSIVHSLAGENNISDSWFTIKCNESSPTGSFPSSQPSGALAGDCLTPEKLAQKYNEPYPKKNASGLTQMISCINSKIGSLIDQNKIFTYERDNELCNYTRGNSVCGSCAHKVNSCHFGGTNGTSGAEAVDFNAKNGDEQKLYQEIVKIKENCKIGYLLFEDNHTHASTTACDGN